MLHAADRVVGIRYTDLKGKKVHFLLTTKGHLNNKPISSNYEDAIERFRSFVYKDETFIGFVYR